MTTRAMLCCRRTGRALRGGAVLAPPLLASRPSLPPPKQLRMAANAGTIPFLASDHRRSMTQTAATLAFVFPGQGSQSVGMLAELAAAHAEVKATFDEASQGAGASLWSLS